MKKIAIIGANGMLGSDLVTYLSKYFSVSAITKENYPKFIGKTFDIVINANGNSKRFWANKNILEDFSLSTYSVYKSIFDFHYEQYIYISSSDVYINHASPLHTKENQKIVSEKLSAYGFHKYLSEQIVKNQTKNHLILRSSMILGSNLKKGPIYDILHKKNLFITMNSSLQMITTKEIANCLTFLIKKKITNETFNLGGKKAVSFKAINKFFSIPVNFSSDAQKQTYEMNVSKINKIFPLKLSEEYLQHFLNAL